MNFESLGDRMKWYEKNFSLAQAVPLLPVILRLDGRAFHTWTKDLETPHDTRFLMCMDATTMDLVERTHALIGYTQSDEISLVFYSSDFKSQIFFDGRMLKMLSGATSICVNTFNSMVKMSFAGSREPACFDCRGFQVPTLREAGLYLLWREEDAVRNSIQAVGQAHFSHNELHKKSQNEIQEMLWQRYKLNWNDLPPRYKRGRYYARKTYECRPTVEELSTLPPKHHAHTDPDFKVTRHSVGILDMPPLSRISNREDVIFNGAVPEEYDEETE